MSESFIFNPFALISLFAVCLVLGLIVYVARQPYQTATLRWLAAVMATIFIWACAELMIRLSGSVAAAQFFKYWEIAGYVLLGPAAVGLSLAYTQKQQYLHQLKWLIVLFAPAAVFIFAAWTQNAFVNFDRPEQWHQAWYGDWVTPLSPFFTWVFVPWLNILILFAIIHLVLYYRSLSSIRIKKQVRLLMVGVAVPAIIGLITDQLYGTITGQVGLELATLTISLSGLWLTYGIIKYQLFKVNPAVLATNILESMPDVVVVCNPQWQIEYVSKQSSSLFGISSNQLVGQPLSKYIKQGWKELFSSSERLDAVQASVEVQLKGSKVPGIPASITQSRYIGSQGQTLAHVLVVTDLRLSHELQQVTKEKNKLQATLSSISDGVIGLTADSTIGLVNDALLEYFNCPADYLVGKDFDSTISLEHKAGPFSLKDLLRQPTPQTSQQFVDVMAKVNDVELAVSIIVSHLPLQSEVDLVAILTVHNVSKERQLEQMKSSFTYLAAHELRTPLTSIQGYLGIAIQELGVSIGTSQQQLLQRAFDSTQHLIRIVSRLLEVSQVEEHQTPPILKSTEWNKAVGQWIKSYKAKSNQEGWSLIVQHSPGSPRVDTDWGSMQQVFDIILDNALTYHQSKPHVTISSSVSQGQLECRISDQGIGMSRELADQLFKPFTRADTGLEQSEHGLGLGLYLAKSLMARQNGSIAVESQLHHGSTFVLRLPIIDQATNDSSQ